MLMRSVLASPWKIHEGSPAVTEIDNAETLAPAMAEVPIFKLVKVPTVVKLEVVIPLGKVVPDKFAAVNDVKFAPLTAPNKPLHVPVVTVPTVVKLEVTTEEFNVVPDNKLAGAGKVVRSIVDDFTLVVI
jgi:hypothetical protein